MDAETEKKIEETVIEILETSDMQEMTEFQVRKLASEKLSIDLSLSSRKRFVRNVVETFLNQQALKQQQNDAVDENASGAEAEEVKEEEEEEEDSNRGDGKEYDDDGDLIICRLSEKRRVTIQNFKGRTLVSMREYYKKDGKFLPTSKGISLTAEQWSIFSKNVPAIEQAIKKMEDY